MDGLPSTLTLRGQSQILLSCGRLVPATVSRLAALLRGGARLAEDELVAIEPDALTHGVLPLLASRSDGGHARAVLREAIALDAARTAGLADALRALDRTGVRALVLKGAHFAVSHYPAPHLRPCSDSDLLIAEPTRIIARRALEAIDFALVPHVRGDLILTQMHFARDSGRYPHALDVHWRVLNPHVFRDLLAFDDAWARSVAIPALGGWARGLCDADAMLLAATHPAAHHSGDERLIWIVDVDRLARAMTPAAWTDFARRARDARVATVARASLATSRDLLGTAVPDGVLDALAADGVEEATAAYLHPATRAQRLWSELLALDGWSTRALYMRQHLFPDRAYMQAAYGGSTIALPWHYFRRAAFGALRWIWR